MILGINFPSTPKQLVHWRKSLGLTQRQAISLLLIGRRTLQDYEAGKNPIPWIVSLSCGMISYDLPMVRREADKRQMNDEDFFDIL